jgi:predicted outer membrane repeat protein
MEAAMKTIVSLTFFLLLFIAPALPAATIHVPNDQPTIQAAVDAAVNGDTILVADGTWDEAEIVGKTLTIRSVNGFADCTVVQILNGFAIGSGSNVTVDGFTITGDGYGIYTAGTAIIENCLITYNMEGGIQSHYSGTVIRNCEISWNANDHQFGGGGIHAWGDFTVDNCLLHHNAAWSDSPGVHGQGGAIWCTFSTATITNCTFHSNYAANAGGAIASSQDHAPLTGRGSETTTVENCILWDNIGGSGNESAYMLDSTLVISHSTVQGGQASCSGSVTWGDGMIEADPLFVTGPSGDHYLSQVAAGQAEDSPCVDSGNPGTKLIDGTTRTDHVADSGIIDMGYHSPPPPEPPTHFLATGPGPAHGNPPLVRVFPPEEDATHIAQWSAYGASSFGVNVTTGDVDGDGASEIITGAGPGAVYGPHVRAFTPGGETVPDLNFLAYGTNKFGVNVAAGDVDGDGMDELVTGAGPGAVFGPHVRGWNHDGTTVSPISGLSFFAYGTPRWGVNVAAGDIDGDGTDEIVTGPGPGNIYGPHVRGWNVGGGSVAAIPGVSYMAYGTFKKGVRVTCGDVDGDGIDEIVTAPGPSPVFGAHIRGWNYDGGTLAEIPGINFFAWQTSESLYGATVSALADLDTDGRADMVVGQGPDPAAATPLKVFGYDGSTTSLLFDLDGYGDSGLTHGINGAAGIR